MAKIPTCCLRGHSGLRAIRNRVSLAILGGALISRGLHSGSACAMDIIQGNNRMFRERNC